MQWILLHLTAPLIRINDLNCFILGLLLVLKSLGNFQMTCPKDIMWDISVQELWVKGSDPGRDRERVIQEMIFILGLGPLMVASDGTVNPSKYGKSLLVSFKCPIRFFTDRVVLTLWAPGFFIRQGCWPITHDFNFIKMLICLWLIILVLFYSLWPLLQCAWIDVS